MRHEQGCHRILPAEGEEHLLHRLARNRVERGERLIHQEKIGGEKEYARQSDALLLSARQLMRIARQQVFQAQLIDQCVQPLRIFIAADALDLCRKQDVFTYCFPCKEPIVLREKPDPQGTRINGRTAAGHLPRGRMKKPCTNAQER